jgi:acetylornithine deacetylase/succinyl-diaminopimelate desuccinylase-like protein
MIYLRMTVCICLFSSTVYAAEAKDRPSSHPGLEIISKQTLEASLSFLASDALEGREAGKTGGRVAAEYIRAELKEAGIKPFFETCFQPFEAFAPAREKNGDFHVHPDSIARYKAMKAFRRLSLQNVIGYIEGERKEEYVIIGAHYDHVGVDDLLVGDRIYNGADDNAASVAALLQIARAFAAGDKKPLRNIVFAFWDGEEVNYLGSEYFVENFENTGAIRAYINLDMISRAGFMPILYPAFKIPEVTEENTAAGNQFHLLYTEELADAGEHVLKTIRRHKLNLEPKPAVIAPQSRGTDCLPFSLRGVPVMWFFTGLHPDYHTPDDETERVDLDKLVEITKAVFLISSHLGTDNE